MKQALNILQVRDTCFHHIRAFFSQRKVLEVDTPSLATFSVSDPYMSPMIAINSRAESLGFLQTSPEYAMKKLLSAGSGDIFQLGKVFRADESSPCHNNEFTMLEWYRIGFNEFDLMDEVFALITEITGYKNRVNLSYRQAFEQLAGVDPFSISEQELAIFAQDKLGKLPDNMLFDNYLTLLFSEIIEPLFDPDAVTFVHDFPATQASLAKTKEVSGVKVACRFEAYCGGLELANGFYELTDADEQLNRFQDDNRIRANLGYPQVAIDHELIRAMKQGLPKSAGVALGVERLLMIKLGETHIKNVLPMAFCDH